MDKDETLLTLTQIIADQSKMIKELSTEIATLKQNQQQYIVQCEKCKKPNCPQTYPWPWYYPIVICDQPNIPQDIWYSYTTTQTSPSKATKSENTEQTSSSTTRVRFEYD